MLHSFPRRQQRGRSIKSTRGFGFTVKWRNRLTTSLSVKILDWAGPKGTKIKKKIPGTKIRVWKEENREKLSERTLEFSFYVHLQQTPQWSWEGSGWVWEPCPRLCVCFLEWAAVAACEPLLLPNAPKLQINAPPLHLEYPSPTLPPVYLKERGGKINQGSVMALILK